MKNNLATVAVEEHIEILNKQLLMQYQQLKTGLVERLIAAYLQEAPKYFANIRSGVESNNYADIIANCHSLKSSSGNLGAVRLSRTCQLMENAAKNKNSNEITELFDILGPEVFETEEALKAERFALQQPS